MKNEEKSNIVTKKQSRKVETLHATSQAFADVYVREHTIHKNDKYGDCFTLFAMTQICHSERSEESILKNDKER